MNRVLAIIGLLLLATVAHAEPIISLPLDGYYRPGKFFPVRITADRPVEARIDVPGGIGARGQGSSLTLPVMVLSPTERSIRVSIDGRSTDVPIRALSDEDWLVLATSPRPVDADHSLPHAGRWLKVALPADALARLDQSYESADQLLLAEADLPKVSDASRRILLASGVTIATDSPEPPTSPWTWRRMGNQFALDLPVRGPVSSADDPAAYDAVADLVPSQPVWIRRTIFLGATLFSILVLAATLLGRRAIYATGAVCVIGIVAGSVFAARQSPVTERTAAIYVPGPLLEQRDEWSFRVSSRLVDEQRPAGGDMMRPIFAGQADDLGMWVETTPSGWRFHYTLPRGKKLAWLTREFIPPLQSNASGPAPGWMACAESDFDPLLRRFYRRQGEAYDVPVLKTISPLIVFRLRSDTSPKKTPG